MFLKSVTEVFRALKIYIQNVFSHSKLLIKLFSPGTHDLSNTCGEKDLDLRNENPGQKYFDILNV